MEYDLDNKDQSYPEDDENSDSEDGKNRDSEANIDIDSPTVAPLALEKRKGKRLQASDMKAWLAQYKLRTRSSTVTGAFVAALLPYDKYDDEVVRQAMVDLKQKTDELRCVYCEGVPTTWDHLTNSVQDRKANGPGHRVYNLVPCCAGCNSSKGGKTFTQWINGYPSASKKRKQIPGTARVSDDRREYLLKLLSEYQSKCPPRTAADIELETQLMAMRDRVLAIFDEADELVRRARPE